MAEEFDYVGYRSMTTDFFLSQKRITRGNNEIDEERRDKNVNLFYRKDC